MKNLADLYFDMMIGYDQLCDLELLLLEAAPEDKPALEQARNETAARVQAAEDAYEAAKKEAGLK